MNPVAASFKSLEQFGIPDRLGVHLMLRGQALGIVLELGWIERCLVDPCISGGTHAPGMQNKDRGRRLPDFP